MPWETIGSSFALVAASEMGDKTQLLAFSLAARFRRPWSVLTGILVATIANHTLASSLGVLISQHVPPRALAGAVAVAFIAFGLWALRPDRGEDATKPPRLGPFLTTTILFFLAEMADKTQLATLVLAARFGSIVLVTIGSTLGMIAADGLAVFLGERLAAKVHGRWLRVSTAILFFGFGLLSAWGALWG